MALFCCFLLLVQLYNFVYICLIINIIKGRRWKGDLIFNAFVLIEEIGCRIGNSGKFRFG